MFELDNELFNPLKSVILISGIPKVKSSDEGFVDVKKIRCLKYNEHDQIYSYLFYQNISIWLCPWISSFFLHLLFALTFSSVAMMF